ncbi:hypothetical protein ACFL6C_07860 [Myxococcota bacterium]
MRHCKWIIACCFLFACGDDPAIEVSLTDHTDGLTDNGSDNLFELEIVTAEAAYAVGELQLEIQMESADPITLDILLSSDGDEDGDVSQGDVITGIEPTDDVLGADVAGQEYDVKLMHTPADEDPAELWSGTWTAS